MRKDQILLLLQLKYAGIGFSCDKQRKGFTIKLYLIVATADTAEIGAKTEGNNNRLAINKGYPAIIMSWVLLFEDATY